jgi:hypothetical protein
MIWWPKVVEVAGGGASYFGPPTDGHSVPGYPRGMAWLCSVGVPFGPPTQQAMLSVTWLCAWLTALLLVRAGREFLSFGESLGIALIFCLLQEVAAHAGSGMADPAIAMAALLAAVGLTRRDDAHGALLAALAGAGAFSIKSEGTVVLLVVAAYLLHDLVRHRQRRRRTLTAIALMLAGVPCVWVRSGQPATRMDVLPVLLAQPDLLFVRVIAAAEGVGACLLPSRNGWSATNVCWTGLLIVICLAVLARWWRHARFVASPAWALLPCAFAVYVTTGVAVRWHVTTTLPRLAVEVVPTCLLAAGIALRRREAGPT